MLNIKNNKSCNHSCKSGSTVASDEDSSDKMREYKKDECTIAATDLTNSDVLLGRGKRADNHIGNKVFRNIIRSFRSEYESSPKKLKRLVARKVVEKIETLNPPGRFIVEQSSGKNGCQLQYYIETDRKKILLKVFRALRQKPKKSNTDYLMDSEPACKNDPRQQMKLLEPSKVFLKFEPLHPFHKGHSPNEQEYHRVDFGARIPCESSLQKCHDVSRVNSTGISTIVGKKKVVGCIKTVTRCHVRLNGRTGNPSRDCRVPVLNETVSTKNSKMQNLTGSKEEQSFDLKKAPVVSEKMYSTQMQGYNNGCNTLQIVPTLNSIWNINSITTNALTKDFVLQNPGETKSLCYPHQNNPNQASLNKSKDNCPFLTYPPYTERMDITECDFSDLEDWNDTY